MKEKIKNKPHSCYSEQIKQHQHLKNTNQQVSSRIQIINSRNNFIPNFHNRIESLNRLPSSICCTQCCCCLYACSVCCCCCSISNRYTCQKNHINRIQTDWACLLKSSISESKDLIEKINKLTQITPRYEDKKSKNIEEFTGKKIQKNNIVKSQKVLNRQSVSVCQSKFNSPIKTHIKKQENSNEEKQKNQDYQPHQYYYNQKPKSKFNPEKYTDLHQINNKFQNTSHQVYKDAKHKNYKHQKEHLINTYQLQKKFRQSIMSKIKPIKKVNRIKSFDYLLK